MLHIFLKNITLPDQQPFDELLAEIPAKLHADITCHRRPDRRRASLWARRMLCQYMEQHELPMQLLSNWQQNSDGKPYCAGIPAFSFSHSGNWVGVAIGGENVGFDIQKLRTVAYPHFFLPYMHTEEQEWLQAQKDQNLAFITLWAKKEALLKLIGAGMAQSLCDFSVTTDQCLYDRQQFFFLPILQTDDVVAFVCTREPAIDYKIIHV